MFAARQFALRLLGQLITDYHGSAKSRSHRYVVSAATFAETADGVAGAGCGRIERSHPAESQERGIENSDHPQSRQTWTSGDGVNGGWLRVL